MNFLNRIGIVSRATGQIIGGGSNSNQDLLRFLVIITGPILSLISIHVLLYAFWEELFDVWVKSFALWFVVVSLVICMFLNFIGVLNGFFYHLTVWILPLICIILYFYKNPIQPKEPEVSKEKPVLTQPVQPKIVDTATGFHRSITITLEKETYWEVRNIGKNTKITVEGMTSKGEHLETIYTTDSEGNLEIKHVPDLLESDCVYASGQPMTFSHIYGDDVPIVHTEPKK